MYPPVHFAITCACPTSLTAQIAVVLAGLILGALVWWRGLLSDSMQKTAGVILFAASASMLSSRASSQSARQVANVQTNCDYGCPQSMYGELAAQPLHYGLIFIGAFGASVILLIVLARILGAMQGKK